MWYALGAVVLALIIIIEAWGGVRADYSAWQICKKRQLIDKKTKNAPLAERDLRRLKLKSQLLSLQFFLILILYLLGFLILQHLTSNLRALVILIFTWYLSNLVAKMPVLNRFVSRRYQALETKLLWFLSKIKFSRYLNLSSTTTVNSEVFDHVDSLSELFFIIDNSPSVLGDRQNSLIKSGIKFLDMTVEKIMTPLNEVFTLEASDVLGPLRIDELHKTGFDFFPVLDKRGQVLGIVDLNTLTNLNNKTTLSAAESIEVNLVSIEFDQSLENLLNRLVSDRVYAAVVTKHGRSIGLVDLKSVLAQLIGHQVW